MEKLETVEIVRWLATGTGIVAAIIVSLKLSNIMTGWGFVIFTASSVAWIFAGYADSLPSLVVQNAVLTVINMAGVYRWMILK